jgi:hypothetical protein
MAIGARRDLAESHYQYWLFPGDSPRPGATSPPPTRPGRPKTGLDPLPLSTGEEASPLPAGSRPVWDEKERRPRAGAGPVALHPRPSSAVPGIVLSGPEHRRERVTLSVRHRPDGLHLGHGELRGACGSGSYPQLAFPSASGGSEDSQGCEVCCVPRSRVLASVHSVSMRVATGCVWDCASECGASSPVTRWPPFGSVA